MTKDSEKLLTKIVVLLFSCILTITGWLAKTEISNMATTLKQIQHDVAALNSKSLLQEQEYKFKFKWVEKSLTRVNVRLSKIESKGSNP